MHYAYATDHFTVYDRTPVTFEYNERSDRSVSDYRFCSVKTGRPYRPLVQLMLDDTGDAARIIETLNTWR